MAVFKVLNEDGSCNGGRGKWSLPTQNEGSWTPGEWMPAIEGKLVPCENGYHLCRSCDLPNWLGPVIYEAEYRGGRIDCDNKVVVREARLLRRLAGWNECTARLFACDCAERVLPLYERKYPNDACPRRVIGVARNYAIGEATNSELAAAWYAAWDAARAAARGAAWDAARAAAWAAAEDAPWYAAWAAARAAEGDAEHDWQALRLIQYLDE